MRAPCCARDCCSSPGAARSATLIEKAPVSRDVVRRFVAGETHRRRRGCRDRAGRDRPARHPRLPRRGHHRPRAGRATGDAYLELLGALSEAGLTQGGRAEVSVKLSRGRPGAPRRRPQDRARERPRHLPGGRQRGHHGHPRHGGPHHHRLDAGDPARAAQGLPGDRRGAAGLPAPHRGRLPRPRLRGLAGAAVQGRLQRARVGRLPGQADVDRSYVRCLKVLHGRRGLPDDRHPRPAAGRDRRVRSPAATAARQGSYEYQMLYGIRPEEQRRLADRGETVRVYVPYGARVVRLPDATAGRAPAEPVILPAVARSPRSEATA